jgi:hypothetical protein
VRGGSSARRRGCYEKPDEQSRELPTVDRH